MQNQDIKYQLLRNSDRDDNPTHRDDDDAVTTIGDNTNQFRFHWTIKLIFFIFICIQLIYVMFSYNSDYIYFPDNSTTTIANDHLLCKANDTNNECLDYETPPLQIITIDQLKESAAAKNQVYNNNNTTDKEIIAIHQLTTERDIREIVVTSERQHPVNGNDEDVVSTTRNLNFERDDHDTAQLITTTSTPHKADSANIQNGKGNKPHHHHNDDATSNKSATSTQKQIGGIEKISTIEKSHDIIQDSKAKTTTAASITSIANYPNEKTVAPNVVGSSGAGGYEQWNIATEVLLPTTTTTATTTFKTPTTARTSTTTKSTTTKSTRKRTTTTSNPLVPPRLTDNEEKTELEKPSTPPEPRKYFINTSRCHIPFIDPLTSKARKIFKPSHTTGCSKSPAIVSSIFVESNKEYILRINYTVAMTFINDSNAETVVDDLLCCYRQIERSGSGGYVDKKFKLLPCTNFHQDFVVPTHINGVIVDCTSKSMKKRLQQDAFSFIHPTNHTHDEKRTENISETENVSSDLRKMGVILIGIDSMSRINFRRTMPETFKFLMDKGWYELRGYNKVGDNTFPNLMPLLTGYTRSTVYKKCKPSSPGGLDNCNFIWTSYREHGFTTAYAEDTADISTFNYNIKGFKKPPTDYYFRPIALAIEKTMHKSSKAQLTYCVGRRQYGEYIYDYGLEFVQRFHNQSNFGLFWTNSFSHNAFDTASTMDGKMLKYLQEIEKQGILETSVVMFFSDHGRRWGELLKLPEGFLEERLPMFHISLPSWFKKEYPYFAQNLQMNQRRLATPFDIYMTMQHLLHMTVPAFNITQAYDCPAAQSILHKIPENRTCTDACIPEAWCTCIPYLVQSTKSKVIKNITQLILKEMNGYFVTKNITSICSNLTLREITGARLRDHQEENTSNTMETYVIEFATNPKTHPGTEFSATVDYDPKRQRIVLNVEDISRQSKYENTAKCIDDKQAKKYCICKNSL